MRRRPRPGSVLTLVAVALGVPTAAGGPLAHYWGDHFGNESVLLGGAVIGSVTDAAALFYNPARLPHEEDPSFVASARVYQWTSVRVRDGLGLGRDLRQTSFGGAPGFLVGTFSLSILANHQFAFGILTRHRAEMGFQLRDERSGDLFASLPGEEDFIGVVDLQTRYKDDWAGLGWAYELSDHLSVGATAFWYDRSFRRTALLDLVAVNQTREVEALEIERSYSVGDKGLVAKAGIAWRNASWSMGLTTTLPYWPLSRSGSIRYQNLAIGLVDTAGGPVDNIVESTVQRNRPTRWKTPWAVGTGVGWSSGPWQLHVSAEYFAGVPGHILLQSDSTVVGQSTGAPIRYTVTEERDAVINGGIGVRWNASEHVSVFASAVTNRSAATGDVIDFTELQPVVSHTSQQMDFVLLGGGLSVRTPWADLAMGATWQGSSEPTPRVLSFPSAEPADGPATLAVDEWRLLLGFSVPLLDERLGDLVGRE
ncbi:MAG: hypothetical protein R3304_05180 [Longimicrobiales bacterium]|nr:hypothetical protein [Longimicrobiales bacterium]